MKAYKDEDIRIILECLDKLSVTGREQAVALGTATQVIELRGKEIDDKKFAQATKGGK